jgi:hypothetical protein
MKIVLTFSPSRCDLLRAARRIVKPYAATLILAQGRKSSLERFVRGENEKICSARRAVARLHRVSPRMKTEIIPGAGHDLVSQAELVSRKAVEFLES